MQSNELAAAIRSLAIRRRANPTQLLLACSDVLAHLFLQIHPANRRQVAARWCAMFLDSLDADDADARPVRH